MIVLDSSAWLSYFAAEANFDVFAPVVDRPEQLLVPTICLFEVYKVTRRQRGDGKATEAAIKMRQGKVVSFTELLAYEAAEVGIEYKLRAADSIIYATAIAYDAALSTQDHDFQDLPGVHVISKKD